MNRARSVEDFVADPVGHFTVGATHLVWCHSPSLCGSTHWGRPSERDARELIRAFELARHPALAGGFDVVMDDRALESIEWNALMVVAEYVWSRLPEWGRRIRHQAVMVPSGPVGLMLAGVVPLFGMTYPMRFFTERGEALDWIGRDEAKALVDQVEQLVDEARGVSPVVRALRQYLDGALANASIAGAARFVGLSPRSLQRELHRRGTQFIAELMQARMRAACLLLDHSDEKIETIARRVGCISSSQLSAIFRRHVGETPARYRERRRAKASY